MHLKGRNVKMKLFFFWYVDKTMKNAFEFRALGDDALLIKTSTIE